MNGRRGFMKCLVGAFVASAVELRLATAPVIESLPVGPVAPTAVLTNEMLDEFYRRLCEDTGGPAFSEDNQKPEFVFYISP